MYISGVSDLAFLSELRKLGYGEVCIKGLRYNPETMGAWMPSQSKALYEGHGIEEVLPEDGWRDRVSEAGLSLLSPKQWYEREGRQLSPSLTRESAIALTDELLAISKIASSSPSAVRDACIARRL